MLGIFDSGLGGLTVVKEVLKRLPNRKVIYFGDTARVPYGNKSPELVKKYAKQGVEFLLSKRAEMIILACNTMSAIAFDDLKKKYKVPIFEVIMPAAKKAVQVTKNGKIGVIGTRATVGSGVYEEKLKITPHHVGCRVSLRAGASGQEAASLRKSKIKVFSQPCPLFVPLVEEGWIKNFETEKIVKEYLKPLQKAKIDTLILGCTHYPMLKKIIQKVVGKKIKLVDSAEEVTKDVSSFFERSGFAYSGTKNGCQIFVSDKTEHLEKWMGNWLGEKVEIKKVVLDS